MYRKLVGWIPGVLVLLLVATQAADAARITPVGWWRLDGNADDSSGNENHGTLVGTPQWVAGKFGDALSFNGTGDRVNCGNGASLNITGPMTVSAWIYPTGSGSSTLPRVVDKSNGTGGADPGYKLYLRPANNYIFTLSAGGAYPNSTLRATLNEWNYVAWVITGTQWKFYVNEGSQELAQTQRPNLSTRALGIGDNASGGRPFAGMIDDVRLYNQALTDEEVQEVRQGPPLPGAASEPIPEDGAADVAREAVLSWKPGEGITSHDVYLGTSFADVNSASRTDPRGVLLGQGQAPGIPVPAPLAFGQTYYWRVDGVGAGAAIFKGSVWSFTVEPYAYPLADVTATASSVKAGMGPENTVNGSGLDAEDRHSTDPQQMWLSTGMPLPNWIQYSFPQPCKLQELWVWNSNQVIEPLIGFGAKDVTIEYSLDGSTWTALAGVPQFARATGKDDYTHNTTVPFGGILARDVKLTIDTNWGGLAQTGLSEVRFFHTPVQARGPAPADGATDVPLDMTLTWRRGREAASHQVYFGTDRDAVAAGTVPAVTVTGLGFTPALEFGATYYWRVDEVNEARTPKVHEGPVWSFTTQQYAVLDDFESYTDKDGEAIWQSWADGLENPAHGGSQVGNDPPPYAEMTIVHGDKQSMPLFYANTAGAVYSEAELTLSPAQNWAAGGAKTLSLWVYGDPNNQGGQLYAKVNGAKVAYDGEPGDLAVAGWRPWNVSLAAFNVNLQKVTSVAVGVDGSGAAGKLYFDDIRIYPRERLLVTPVEPNTTGLVAYYKLDQDASDSSGNQNHGTVHGNPPWLPGKIGNAVSLDGGHDYIDCGNPASLNLAGPMTIVAWMQPTGPGGGGFGRLLDKSSGTGATDPGYKLYHRATENYIMTLSVGGGDHRSGAGLVLNSWNFFALAITGVQWQCCLNGVWNIWAETAVPTVVENPLYLGHASLAERYFQGQLDDIRIYNRALTPGEIAWLAGRTKPFDLPF